jgi:hypothetical protein
MLKGKEYNGNLSQTNNDVRELISIAVIGIEMIKSSKVFLEGIK